MFGKLNDNKSRTNFWDVLIYFLQMTINRGILLPIFILIFGFLFYIFLDPNKRFDVILHLINLFEHWHILGWILSLITTLGWKISTKNIRKSAAQEVDRIAKENTKLQEALIEIKLNITKN